MSALDPNQEKQTAPEAQAAQAPAAPAPRFEMDGSNIKGTLTNGIEIDGVRQKDFVMRPANTGDMFAAEDIATADKPMAFTGALISVTLVSIGTLKGPIPFTIIKNLKIADFNILSDAREELERLGESEQHG